MQALGSRESAADTNFHVDHRSLRLKPRVAFHAQMIFDWSHRQLWQDGCAFVECFIRGIIAV
jgi:hypothetical protein